MDATKLILGFEPLISTLAVHWTCMGTSSSSPFYHFAPFILLLVRVHNDDFALRAQHVLARSVNVHTGGRVCMGERCVSHGESEWLLGCC